MKFLPIFTKCQARSALVVGGGKIATRKIQLMRKSGIRIKVVAPAVSEQIGLLVKQQGITLLQREFKDSDIDHMFIVITTTDDETLNTHISKLCKDKKILVNNVNSVEDSDFIFPGTIDRDPIQIAINTGGASPSLTRLLTKHLTNCTPPAYSQLANLMQQYREQVKTTFTDLEARRLFWDQVLCGPVSSLIFSGRTKEAEELFLQILRDKNSGDSSVGEVYLVGAGPGDPDLLTFKALRLMQQANIIIYDRLVSQQIMDLLPVGVKKIYVGKENTKHTVQQGGINQMLVEHAKRGDRVLRLKGGDPFIFGRGGEEMETLMENNIPFQIVPGITAASGCAAYAGIPLTHRDYAQNCIFVTGHLKDGSVDLDWELLSRPQQTVVVYMGLHGLDQICSKLVVHGLSADTPIALITSGTNPEQHVFVSTLSELTKSIENQAIKPPTLLIIGNVVLLRSKLKWFS